MRHSRSGWFWCHDQERWLKWFQVWLWLNSSYQALGVIHFPGFDSRLRSCISGALSDGCSLCLQDKWISAEQKAEITSETTLKCLLYNLTFSPASLHQHAAFSTQHSENKTKKKKNPETTPTVMFCSINLFNLNSKLAYVWSHQWRSI